jgi:protein gp37
VATWPLPNVWLGVSVENQQAADERIPLLLDTPAAHRWLSVEPLLGAVDLRRVSPGLLGTSAIFDALGGRRWEDNGETLNATACARLDWVVVGGESGPKARTMDVEWMSDLQQQCLSADVPFYCKQDSGPRPGMQGRILDALWAVKQLPGGWA